MALSLRSASRVWLPMWAPTGAACTWGPPWLWVPLLATTSAGTVLLLVLTWRDIRYMD